MTRAGVPTAILSGGIGLFTRLEALITDQTGVGSPPQDDEHIRVGQILKTKLKLKILT